MIFIILPVHNEEKHIRDTAQKLMFWIGSNYQIIYVNDHSTDNTFNELKGLDGIVLLDNTYPPGKGSALKYGFDIINTQENDLIIFLDGDGQIPFRNIEVLLDVFFARIDADVVIGNKRDTCKYSFKRRIVSKSYNFLVRKLFNFSFTDTQCGIKLFKASVLKEVMPMIKSNKFAFDIELLVELKKKGFKIYDVPVTITKQLNSGSVNIKNILETFSDTLKIYFKNC